MLYIELSIGALYRIRSICKTSKMMKNDDFDKIVKNVIFRHFCCFFHFFTKCKNRHFWHFWKKWKKGRKTSFLAQKHPFFAYFSICATFFPYLTLKNDQKRYLFSRSFFKILSGFWAEKTLSKAHCSEKTENPHFFQLFWGL
jgi:hypothetical protein